MYFRICKDGEWMTVKLTEAQMAQARANCVSSFMRTWEKIQSNPKTKALPLECQAILADKLVSPAFYEAEKIAYDVVYGTDREEKVIDERPSKPQSSAVSSQHAATKVASGDVNSSDDTDDIPF